MGPSLRAGGPPVPVVVVQGQGVCFRDGVEVGVAVAVADSVVVGGSTTISVDVRPSSTVSMGSASVWLMVGPY